MLQKVKKSYKFILLASVLLLVGCGGGGSSKHILASKPDTSKMAKIDNDNASQSVLSTYQSIVEPEDLDFAQMGKKISSNRIFSKSLKLISRSDKSYNASNQCDSGKATVEAQDKYSATIDFNNCTIDNFVLNGEAIYSEDEYGTKKIEYSDFRANNNSSSIYIEHMIYLVDETTNGKTIKDAYATYEVGGKVLKYFNYNSQRDGGTFKFNGYIKPICLSGYVYIESKDKLVNIDNENSNKPEIEGSFIIKTTNKTVKVDADKDLIYITLPNEKVEVYNYDDILNAIKFDGCSVSIKPTLPYRPKSNDFIKLTDDTNTNTKIASAVYKASNLNSNKNFPKLEDILNNVDNGLSCISGDINEQDNGNKINAIYKNCEISSGVFYDGNISFELQDGIVSQMFLNNLTIKQNSNATVVKYAKVYETFEDDSYGGVDTNFKIENMYASINKNEYLDFNFTNTTNTTEGNEKNDKIFSGYIKTSCLNKYANMNSSLMSYDANDTLLSGNFSISDNYIDNSNEVDDDLSVRIDSSENSVEITLEVDPQPFAITIDEFLNKCK